MKLGAQSSTSQWQLKLQGLISSEMYPTVITPSFFYLIFLALLASPHDPGGQAP